MTSFSMIASDAHSTARIYAGARVRNSSLSKFSVVGGVLGLTPQNYRSTRGLKEITTSSLPSWGGTPTQV